MNALRMHNVRSDRALALQHTPALVGEKRVLKQYCSDPAASREHTHARQPWRPLTLVRRRAPRIFQPCLA